MHGFRSSGRNRNDAWRRSAPAVLASTLLLAACAQPLGPTVQVLPGKGKDFAAFQVDQRDCSLYTNDQVRPLRETVERQQLGTALIGTVLGAGLGAAVGGGRGAGIGAAAGSLTGTAYGTDRADRATDRLQVTYDNTYAGCMAAHGDVVRTPTILVQPAAVLVQPAPYVVQPAPYVVQPAPYAVQQGTVAQ